MNIGDDKLKTIDWLALKTSNMTLSKERRDTINRFAYQWAATGAHNRLLYGDNDWCLNYGQQKNHEHVILCKASGVLEASTGTL